MRRLDRRDMVAKASLGMVAIGVPLWLSAAARAMGVPSNDDWVYKRAVDILYRTGGFDVTGHTAAFIGQIVSPRITTRWRVRSAGTQLVLAVVIAGVAIAYLPLLWLVVALLLVACLESARWMVAQAAPAKA